MASNEREQANLPEFPSADSVDGVCEDRTDESRQTAARLAKAGDRGVDILCFDISQ